jgi:hypothetical protein
MSGRVVRETRAGARRRSGSRFILALALAASAGAIAAAPARAGDPAAGVADAGRPGAGTAADSLVADSLAVAAAGRGAPATPARIVWTAGAEVDALRQAFGFASLFNAGEGGLGEVTPEGTRYREREAEVLGLLGVQWEAPAPHRWSANAGLQARAGERRRALSLSGETACNAGALRGLRVRELFLWDDEAPADSGKDLSSDGLASAQNLLQFRWNPCGAGRGRDVALRGALDISRADAGAAARDSGLASYADYLDYTRVSLGVGLVSSGLSGSEIFVDVSRKQSTSRVQSDYEALTVAWARTVYGLRGGLDLEVRGERRRYEARSVAADSLDSPDSLGTASSALRSYYETEFYARWTREWSHLDLETHARVTGSLYDRLADDGAAADDSLAWTLPVDAAYADRVRLEGTLLLGRSLVRDDAFDSPDPITDAPRSAPRSLESLRVAAGLTTDLLWVDSGAGDARGLGGRAEVHLRAGRRLGEAWLELGAEVGRRVYPGRQGTLVFDVGETTFSLTQTDYAYAELSLVGGGRLPFGFAWEVSAFGDRESHTRSEDDVELFSVRAALERSWGPRP